MKTEKNTNLMLYNSSDRDSLPVARPVARPAAADVSYDLFVDARLFPVGRSILEIGLIFGVLFLPYLFFLAYGLFTGNFVEPSFQTLGMKVYLRVVLSGLLVVLVTLILLKWDRSGLRSVGVRKSRWLGEISSAFWAFVLIYTIQIFVMVVIARLFPDWAETLTKRRVEMTNIFPVIPPVCLFFFTLFVGIYEELVFRGFLITRLTAIVGRPWLAVVLSSVLFGAVHFYQDPLAMVQIMIIAFVLGGLFVIRKNILAPILVHMSFDFISLGMAFWGKQILAELSKSHLFHF